MKMRQRALGNHEVEPGLGIPGADRQLIGQALEIERRGRRADREEAIGLLQDATASRSSSGHLWHTLGLIQKRLPAPRAALESLEHAYSLAPTEPGFAYSFANALLHLNQRRTAEGVAERLTASHPDSPLACLLAAQLRYFDGAYNDADAAYRETIRRDPNLRAAHIAFGQCLLVRGRYREGFGEVRFGLPEPPSMNRLAGRRVLVKAGPGDGLGDILQASRFLPQLASRVADLIFQCPSTLHRMLGRMAGMPRLLPWGSSNVDHELTLTTAELTHQYFNEGRANATKPGEATVPHPPELNKPLALTTGVRRALGLPGPGPWLRVGLVWAGNPEHLNDHRRSIDLRTLAPLFTVAGVKWLSLQVGPRAHEADAVAGLQRMKQPARDFLDTGLLLSELDLVITVDTSCAHLAGSLNLPTWTLVSRPLEWRWLADSSATPWYPAMRIFQQREPGDWSDAVLQLTRRLRELAP